MSISDPIADLLTRIRNAILVKKETVRASYSKIKWELLNTLEREGYIRSHELIEDGNKKDILVYLKYAAGGEPVISNLNRVSTPGCRIYRQLGDITVVLNGLGISIISTSHGVLSDRECREKKVGGEVICEVW